MKIVQVAANPSDLHRTLDGGEPTRQRYDGTQYTVFLAECSVKQGVSRAFRGHYSTSSYSIDQSSPSSMPQLRFGNIAARR